MVKSASNRASEQAVQTVRPLNNNSANSLGGPEGFDEQVRNILCAAQVPNLSPPTTRHTRKPRTTPAIAIAMRVCFLFFVVQSGVDIYLGLSLQSPQSTSCVRLSRIGGPHGHRCRVWQSSYIIIAKDMITTGDVETTNWQLALLEEIPQFRQQMVYQIRVKTR